MKNFSVYRKTVGFLTAAMTFAAAVTACSNTDDSAESEVTSAASTTEAVTETETETVSEPSVPTTVIADVSVCSDVIDIDGIFSKRDRDPSYDSLSAEIVLEGDSASVEGSGASAENSSVKITEEGVYRVTGTLDDGQLIVEAPKAKVQLVLDNAEITCKNASPIYIADCDKTFITLADGSDNSVTDGRSALPLDADDEEESSVPDAAIFSADSLTINGTGKLAVKGGYKDGIHSQDDVVITGGTLNVTASCNGIKGKDYVAAAGGTVTVNAENDGIKSTNSEDSSRGFIYVENGSFSITAGGDGFQAETLFLAETGSFDITSGGGNENGKEHSDGFGGFGGGGNFGGGNIKPPTDGGNLELPDNFKDKFNGNFPDMGGIDIPDDFKDKFNGNFPDMGEINIPDDIKDKFGNGEMPDFGDRKPPTGGFENNGSGSSGDSGTSSKGIKAGSHIGINGGEFKVDSADDALHSNGSLEISDGSVTITSGDKGIHADSTLTISGGADVTITKSYEGIEGAVISVTGGKVDVTASDDGFNASDGSTQGAMGSNSSGVMLYISGGTVYVDAEGDGIDSNGSIEISGGTVIVNGPQNGGNGALDSNGKITVSGGLLIAAGNASMAEYPDDDSTQNCVSVNLGKTLGADTLLALTDSSGNEILSFAPAKKFGHVVISSPDIKSGKTYTLFSGGSSASKSDHGLYEIGGYKNDGSEEGSFTAESSVSFIGDKGFGGFGGFGGGGFGDGNKPDGDGNGRPQRPNGGKPNKNSDNT